MLPTFTNLVFLSRLFTFLDTSIVLFTFCYVFLFILSSISREVVRSAIVRKMRDLGANTDFTPLCTTLFFLVINEEFPLFLIQ